MKILKIAVIVFLAYVGVVVVFESLLGYVQPEAATTLVIITFDDDGSAHERVLSRLESGGRLYVAANHWPRAWYERALENPEVEIIQDGQTVAYRAVPVRSAEHDQVDADNRLGPAFRLLTGFPSRTFLRLDPR